MVKQPSMRHSLFSHSHVYQACVLSWFSTPQQRLSQRLPYMYGFNVLYMPQEAIDSWRVQSPVMFFKGVREPTTQQKL